MTITLEYDQSEDIDHQQATESEQFNSLRFVHIIPPIIIAASGLLLGLLSFALLLLRDMEDGSFVTTPAVDFVQLREGLIIWSIVGASLFLAGLLLLALCNIVLRFRRPTSELRYFLQELAGEQPDGEGRDLSIFNTNQHFRRFPPFAVSEKST